MLNANAPAAPASAATLASSAVGNLTQLRKDAGLTQLELANTLGITQSQVSMIEKNQRPLTDTLRVSWLAAVGANEDGCSRTTWSAIFGDRDCGWCGHKHIGDCRGKAT